MPAVLNINPQEVDSLEKRSKYTVGVVGCWQRGIFYANAFADAGFRVVCTDADPSITKKAAKGKTPNSPPEAEAKLKNHITTGKIIVSGDIKKTVSQSDIITITVMSKIDEQKKTDTSQVSNACKQVGAALKQGSLVIYGGIAAFGFSENSMRETLENTSGLKTGLDFGLAYNPLLGIQEDAAFIVAADDPASLNAATNILGTIMKNVQAIRDFKVAEVAALFTVAKQDANLALANELAMLCEDANLDYFEVLKHLDSSDHAFCPSVAQDQNKQEAYLLLDSAENLNTRLRLPTLARQINEDMLKHAVILTQDALRSCDKAFRRARVAVFGRASEGSDTEAFVRMIEQKGAKVTVYDPTAKKASFDLRAVKSTLNEAVEGVDCIVVFSLQEQLNHLNLKKLRALMKSPSVIVDLAGKFSPEQVKTEGFIYRGLGRGTG